MLLCTKIFSQRIHVKLMHRKLTNDYCLCLFANTLHKKGFGHQIYVDGQYGDGHVQDGIGES